MLSTEPSRRITAYSTTSPSTRSLTRVGGYFGSTFFSGTGPDKSPEAMRGPSALPRSSEKLRIQLPVALLNWACLQRACTPFSTQKSFLAWRRAATRQNPADRCARPRLRSHLSDLGG